MKKEVEDLHRFLVEWLSGTCPRTDRVFEERFVQRFAPDFQMIPPAGQGMEAATLFAGLRRGHGSNPRFRIAIRRIHVLSEGQDLVVASYEEWQRNARNSPRPNNGRISTAIFRRDKGRVFGPLRWQHLHETWLPSEQVERASFDF